MGEKRHARALAWIAAVLGALAALTVGVLVAFEYRPRAVEPTPITGDGASAPAGAELDLVSWNIGYAGLDAGADFFLDGGSHSRPESRERVEANLAAIAAWLGDHPADAVLLQEVDSPSSRTWEVDEVAALVAALPSFAWARAVNFRVPWIPAPLLSPLGRVESGLLSLCRVRPVGARRLQLPGLRPWPLRVFHLKRCLHELHLPGPDGADWVLLHLHLDTFDRGGLLRREQLDFVRRRMQALWADGAHVIAGGDWNHAPPGLAERAFAASAPTPDWFQTLPENWTPPGWSWAFDPARPSLRAANEPYRPGETFVTTVDAFLLGPDVEPLSVETVDLGFAHSDHQPVRLRVRLRPPNP